MEEFRGVYDRASEIGLHRLMHACEVGGPKSIAVTHRAWERREIAVSSDRLSQDLTRGIEQVHQLFSTWAKPGGVSFDYVARFLKTEDERRFGLCGHAENDTTGVADGDVLITIATSAVC